MEPKAQALPGPVLRRLPRYLIHVRELKKAGLTWVSSQSLGEALGLTMSTVRQDMSHLALMGVSKRGYEVSKLESVLKDELGANTIHRTVLVGAGYLGCALALHGDWAEHGFETVAIFDADPRVVGSHVGRLTVRPMSLLRRTVESRKVDIGIIAVPASAAQQVANELISAGIKGLLNLPHVHLQVPRGIYVVDARIIARMQQLAYAIRTSRTSGVEY